MNKDMDSLRERIIAGRSAHAVAAMLVAEARRDFQFGKSIAAAKLAWIFRMGFDDALSVVSEMW